MFKFGRETHALIALTNLVSSAVSHSTVEPGMLMVAPMNEFWLGITHRRVTFALSRKKMASERLANRSRSSFDRQKRATSMKPRTQQWGRASRAADIRIEAEAGTPVTWVDVAIHCDMATCRCSPTPRKPER